MEFYIFVAVRDNQPRVDTISYSERVTERLLVRSELGIVKWTDTLELPILELKSNGWKVVKAKLVIEED